MSLNKMLIQLRRTSGYQLPPRHETANGEPPWTDTRGGEVTIIGPWWLAIETGKHLENCIHS